MIQVEAHRNTLPQYTACVAKTPIEYCTMQNSKDLCNILVKSSYSDRYYVKYPKLAELHEYLFGSIPTGLHNSMIDVIARSQRLLGKEVYFPWGVDRNGINIEFTVEKNTKRKMKTYDRAEFLKLSTVPP